MSLITNAFPTSCFVPPVFGSAFPSTVVVSNPRCASNSHHMAAIENRCSLLFSKGSFYGCSGVVRRCKGFDSGGDFALEAEILEFMESSRNPEAFPSRKDLIDAGREDLVDAIVDNGGWLCLGWNLDEQLYGGVGNFYLEEISDSFGEFNELKIYDRQRFPTACSVTGRSLETVSEHESGIEGMLSRLEKERNATPVTGKEYLHPETMAKEVHVREERSREVTLGSRGDPTNSNSGKEKMNHSQIQHHLQNMKLEVSSAIGALRSNSFAYEKGQSSKSSDDLLELSDAYEFQENEILNVKDKLRSTRAKLAVVEAKMALTIIDAQKVIDEKQKMVNCAQRALQFFRTACVFWPNSAAEVLLVGSFDAWSTQWKMEKSSTGVFSLFLKLYPGKYEIKFIVDGQWEIDLLRPIVRNHGYENNLLIVM